MKKSIEKKAFDVLEEKSYDVTLGNKKFKFNPINLSGRERISTVVANLKIKFNEGMKDSELLAEAIESGKYSREIAEFIIAGSHTKGRFRKLKEWILFKSIFYDADNSEIKKAVIHIMEQIEPAFFLGIIISLNRQNMMKPTKETEATALG